MAMTEIVPGVYRHMKGNYYLVLGTATNTENKERMVVYVGLYNHPEHGLGAPWVRPLENFAAMVEFGEERIQRFAYIGPPGTVHVD